MRRYHDIQTHILLDAKTSVTHLPLVYTLTKSQEPGPYGPNHDVVVTLRCFWLLFCDSLTIMLHQQNFMTQQNPCLLSKTFDLWFLTDNFHFKTKTAFPEIKIQECLEFLPSLALTGFHLSGWRLAPKQQQELRSCFASRETGKQDSRWSGLRLLKCWNWDSTTHRPWRKEWNDGTIFTAFCEFALKDLGITMAY